MVRLNDDQERKLRAVSESKSRFDRELTKLDADYEARKEALKAPIRAAVADAAASKVPTRRIHLDGLGFAQVSSMMNFLEDKRKSLGERISELGATEILPEVQAKVEEKVPVWQEFAPNEYQLDFDGESYSLLVGEPEDGVTVAKLEGVDDEDWPNWVHDEVSIHLPMAYHGYEQYMTGGDDE